MRCGLCDFLIIKPQTTLHHTVWCNITCDAVMPFYGRFWCDFCSLCGLCSLVNTPSCSGFLFLFLRYTLVIVFFFLIDFLGVVHYAVELKFNI